MSRAWPALLLAALSGGPGLAQERGLLDTPACQRAMAALDAREAAAAKDRSARGALDTARRQAATACLGGRDRATPTPARAAQAITVPPAAQSAALPRPSAVPAPAATATPLPRPAAPLAVTACDATGCWASDGSRLQRVGPNLLGPAGQSCTSSGTLLHCTR
jgi:hypothetical protein